MTSYRLVVVGDGGVGKSALSIRFVQGNFVHHYDPTIEANYRKQVTVGEDSVLLDILDTAGQEEYSVLREQYMRMGDAFLLVYSIIQPQTFSAVSRLHAQALKFARQKPVFVIAGNKCDLEKERSVTTQEGKELADGLACQFFEVSAKMNKNVTEAFMALVKALHSSRKETTVKKHHTCVLL